MSLKISKPVKTSGSTVRFTATISMGKKAQDIWYESDYFAETDEVSAANAFLASTLIVAMKLGEDIISEAPVSLSLLAGLEEVQSIFSSWFPELKRVKVQAETVQSTSKGTGRRATTFSGGVDSFYTLLKHKDTINYLVNVHGFDVELQDKKVFDVVNQSFVVTAEHYNKELISVTSNIREFSDAYVDWGYHYHGSAIASVAHLLSNTVDVLYVPSSYHYSVLFPWSSHPLVDPLWGDDTISLIHDGSDMSRFDKVAYVSRDKFAINNLTVCWQRIELPEGERNCSRCEKCIRTMVALDALGRLAHQNSFVQKIDPVVLNSLTITNDHDLIFIQENYEHIARLKHSHNEVILSALKKSIDDYLAARLIRDIKDNLVYVDKILRDDGIAYSLADGLWHSRVKLMVRLMPAAVMRKIRSKLK